MKKEMEKREEKRMITLVVVVAVLLILTGVLIALFLSYKNNSDIANAPQEAFQDDFSYALWTKVKAANLSDREFHDLLEELRNDRAITVDRINEMEPLRLNENGITYGVDVLGAELISVYADDWTEGYVYRSELEGSVPGSIEEALAVSGKQQSYTVYEADGVTAIGTFTPGKEKEETR